MPSRFRLCWVFPYHLKRVPFCALAQQGRFIHVTEEGDKILYEAGITQGKGEDRIHKLQAISKREVLTVGDL